jgi:hypothetical protein
MGSAPLQDAEQKARIWDHSKFLKKWVFPRFADGMPAYGFHHRRHLRFRREPLAVPIIVVFAA